MTNDILIISKKETFMSATLKRNLTLEGYEVNTCIPSVEAINSFKDKVNMYIYYMDEGVAVDMDSVVLLNDLCVEEENLVILLGAESGFEAATRIIPEENLAAWFLRPIDMRAFIDKINALAVEREKGQRKKSILIVDDDITFLKMAQTWLKDKYRVSIVNSGMKAITWLAKNYADLLILDYEMPVADGPSILEMLKSEIGTDTIPVFFFTGKSDVDSISKAIGLKPERYLLKTIGKDALLEEIDKFFIEQKTIRN